MTTFLLLDIIGFMIYFAAEHHKEKKNGIKKDACTHLLFKLFKK